MPIRVATEPLTKIAADWLVVPVIEGAEPGADQRTIDEALGGTLGRLRKAGDLTGKLGELVALRDAPGIAADRLLLIGVGKWTDLDAAKLNRAMMTAARAISDKKDRRVAVAVPPLEGSSLAADRAAQTIASAMIVGAVGQDLYRKEPARYPFADVAVVAAGGMELSAAVERGRIVGEAINLARELVNQPPSEIYPENFAKRAQEVAAECGLKCEVLDEKQLATERMNAMLAVGQGSDRPPRMVVLEYRGAGAGAPTLGLVGKGVTFDSGGLSIKTAEGMLTMKCDMAGAAAVVAAITAIARLKLPVNVTAFAGLVENMINGSAYKVGDVLRARNGVTIEVLNTDAEGRIVLADVLSYAVDRGMDRLVNLATLTGACVVALGEEVAGAFTNDQTWCDSVLQAAKTAGEDVWQMPMLPLFDEMIKSEVADIRNTGGSRWGGAITAAKFLERFVGGKPWVHLDIAGPAFASGNKPHREGGGTGCMVSTLVELASAG